MAKSTDASDGGRTSGVVQRRELARHMRALRIASGLKQPEAAQQMRNISRAKLQYLERGDLLIPAADIEVMLEAYGASPADRETAADLATRAAERGWWDQFTDVDMPRGAKLYAGLEWGARRLRVFYGSLIEALTQVPAYSEAVLAASDTPRSPEQVRKSLEAREHRKAILDEPDPVDFRLVMTEGALLGQAGTASVMVDQLTHLRRLMETHPNVDVRVVPFGAGVYPATVPRFTIMDFGPDHSLVHMEHGLGRTAYVEEQDEVYFYSRVFERVGGLALGPSETLELLQSVADQWAQRAEDDTTE